MNPEFAPHIGSRPHALPAIAALSVLLLCSAIALAPAALAKDKSAATPSSAAVAEKKDDLKELRGQIEALRKEMLNAEGKRADVADQLKDVEHAISVTQRDLQALTAQRNRLQSVVKDLGNQSRELENRLDNQQQQLEKLVYRQYLQGNPDSLRLLLNGDDPNQLARDLHYLAAVGQARSELLQGIETSLQRKQALAKDTQERAEELAAIEASQKSEQDKLLAQRQQRKIVLDSISAKISEHRREIGNLQRDEKQLSQLIDKLAKILARKPAPRPKAPRKPATHATETTETTEARQSGASSKTELGTENTPDASTSGSFAGLKGRLRLPIRGTISNRFGETRQEGSRWKGLFIRATAGSEVKAIADGRVVFADWMRGFGNLMIIDHGASYLSVYGNNDALLKQVGDALHSGETIATVGNSGGNPDSGLYFELRHQGQPLDPLKWVNLK